MQLHPRGSYLPSCRSLLLRPRVTRALSSYSSRRLARKHTRLHVHVYGTRLHVHACDARRAKRRAKESAPCRPELSRSHGSCSGSGGDIPTYLPTYRAGCAGACVSQAPLHILLPFSSFFLILVIFSRLFLLDSLLLPPLHRHTAL